jgi:hypothetical protein
MALRSSIFSVNSLKKLSGKYATLLRHAQLKFDIFFCPLKTLIFLGYDSDFQLLYSEHQTSRKSFCGGFEDHLQISTWEDGFRIIKDRYEIT